MKLFLRYSYLFIFLIISNLLFSVRLYWVGGSGNFNDPAHWSLQSGGTGGVKIPSFSDDVHFDENSFTGPTLINFVGNTQVHDLIFSKYTDKVTFSGLQNEEIEVAGELKLNAYIDNQFKGTIRLISGLPTTHVAFSLFTVRGKLYLDGNTNWVMEGNIVGDENSTINLSRGVFNLPNSVIYANDVIATSQVTINTQQTTFIAKHKFVLPNGIIFNDGGCDIYARTKSTDYQVDSGVNFNSSSRFKNVFGVASTCNVTQNGAAITPTCAGACDGSVSFSIPAACSSNPVYAVWTVGSAPCTPVPTATLIPGTTYTVGGLCGCSQQYFVNFTNDPNTQDSTFAPFAISIADPAPPRIKTLVSVPPTCFGSCNGYIIATIDIFGTPLITSHWTSTTFTGTVNHPGLPFNKKDTLLNACAGGYTVSLTDANGCASTQTFTVNLTQPTAVSSTLTPTNLLCNAICNGSISASVNGGTPGAGYTYTWTAAGGTVTSTTNTSTYSNLCAGTYTFITADANNCRDTNTAIVTEPPPITFSKVPPSGAITILCNNTCDGSVGVTGVTGGTGPYTFGWAPVGGSVSNTATSSTYSNLCGSVAGTTYTCTITDANNCTQTTTFTVTSPPALSNTITATQPLCVAGQGSPVGSATVTESGGVAPYTFTWSPGGTQSGASPSSIYSNLSPGTYTVQMTDANGCLDTTTVTINAPTPVTGTITTTIDPTCPSQANGQLCVTAGGGAGGFTYTWTPIGGNASCTPATLTVTPGGTSVYTVTISDVNSCTVAVTGTLTAPPQATFNAAITHPPCSGTCNGSATVTPVGGIGPFTYVWSCSASTTGIISGQCGGTTCNYTVTDAGTNCTNTGSVSFTVAPSLTVAISATALPCSYSCNSAITTTVTGGTPGYTYAWTGTGANPVCAACPSQTNMCAGNYTVVVTDNLGCQRTATVAVTGPPALSNTVSVTNPPCTAGQGTAVGSATVTASGGVAAYTFTWSAGATVGGVSPVSTGSNMNAGTYTVFITDASGCLDTALVTLTPPTAVSGTITTTTNPTCPNLNNGQLCVTAGGGSGVYTYTWTPTGGNASCSAATLTVTAGGSSVYTVTVSDALSCTVAVTGTLTSPPQATVTASQTNPACGSAPCTGSATLTPNGGIGPFTYQWSCSGSVTNTISGQCGGTSCTYTATDVGTNCRYTGTVVFAPAPPTLTVTIAATALNCNNDCNSTITTTVSGGSPGFTYAWTGTGANPVIPGSATGQVNMCAGAYTVVVTDNLGCQQTATVNIANPPALTVTVNATQPSCSGICDGSMTVTTTGGTAPYPGVSWSPSVSPPNAPNTTTPSGLCGTLAPGTVYTVTITDNAGCLATGTATLTTPPGLTVTVNVDSVTCNGLCNGTATAVVGGGTPGYTYSWDNGAFTNSDDTSGLCAGSHTLVVRDAGNCIATTQIFQIDEPFSLGVSVNGIINTCGPCSGGATANPTGGTGPYTYTWSPTGGNASTADSLCIGNYTLTINDANNCGPVSTTFTINTIVSITIVATSQSVSCTGACDGVANATASTGTAPYNMVWTTSPGGAVVTTCNNVVNCSATGLCPGVYVVTATDQNGCINSDSVSIGDPPVLTATVTSTNVQCFGSCTGSATLTPGGGTPGYSVLWSTGASGTTISNLCPGNYTATVTDSRGCQNPQTFTITSSPQFTVSNTTVAPVACGGATGSIEVTASGGTAGYTFNWNPVGGGTVTSVTPTSTLSGVPAGIYSVTITDVNGCDTTIQIGLSDPGSPVITATTTPESCFGSCDGSATVTAVGVAPITVTWQGGAPTGPSPLTVGSLCNPLGGYMVQATDGNGCLAAQPVLVGGPSQIDDNEAITHPTCTTAGSITLTPSGGSGAGYTYSWSSSGNTTNIESGLSGPSVITCTVTDGTSCSQTFTYNINAATALTVTVFPNNTLCSYSSNGSASANATGTGPYTYTWTGSSGVLASGSGVTNVSNLPAGTYTLDVVDASGCTNSQTFTISSAPAIVANFGKNDNLCNAGCTGSATVAPTGGTGSYTYSWPGVAGAPTTSVITNVCPGTYSVIITDAPNSCTDTTAFTIIQPPLLTASITSTSVTCFGMCTGSATVVPSGGTGTSYTVGWSPNVCLNCPVATNLCTGTQYTVITSDTNNCQDIQVFQIASPAPLVATPTITQPLCAGDSNGVISASVSGGTQAYSYTWTAAGTVVNTATTTTNSNLPPGTYTLIVNDINGCSDTSNYTLNAPTPIGAAFSSTSATCGQQNGSITISSTTGNGPVTINWLPPSTCGTATVCTNLGAGVYDIELTDSAGCRDTLQAAISNPNGPQIDSIVVHNNCFNDCNGSITITVVSGVNTTNPYTFTWTPNGAGTVTSGTATSTFSNLCGNFGNPQTYIGLVQDDSLCITATSFTISSPSVITDQGNFTNATCQGVNDGTISALGFGGTPSVSGYTYTLNGTTTNTTGIFTGLAVGQHTVCIGDSLNCSQCFIYNIGGNITVLSQIDSTNETCATLCDGTATLSNVSGGTAPYIIAWSNGQSTPIASGLCPGSYTATITDQNGCQAVDTISIVGPQPISPNQVVTLPACGQCNGSITIAPTGGTPGVLTAYTYTWNTGATGTSVTNICAGIYQVDIIDSVGCLQSFQVGVSNDSAAALSTTATSPACSNQCTGSATVTPVGGTPPFTYSWPSVPSSSPTVSNLCSGIYFVQVQDSLGCISTDSVQILPNNTLNVATSMSNPPCGVCNGQIVATAGGGSGNYTYNWLPGNIPNDTISSVCAGNYTLVVTDVGTGCTDSSTIGLNSAAGPILTISSTDVPCNGACSGTATVVANNGTPTYTYQWDNGMTTDTISGLCPNTYNVVVTDNAGCIQTGQVVISQPNQLIASLPTIVQPVCFNDCNGSITIVISGGTPVYTYAWNPGTVTGTGGSGLCPGNYSVTVTDANGCTVTELDTLFNPAQLVITGSVVPASCNNSSDGAINTTTTGGTPSLTAPGYTWQWSGGSTATTPNLSSLPIGTYTVVVADSRNCTDTANFNVISTNTVIVNAGNDTTACAIDTLVLNGIVNAGTTVQWIQLPNPPGPVLGTTASLTLTPVANGTTQYVLIGLNGGCTLSDTISVTSNALPTPDAGIAGSIFTGFSYNIGGSPTNPSGGTVVWSPGITLSDSTSTNPAASPTVTTTYTVFETNSNGCVGIDTVTVLVLPTFVIPNGFSPNGDGWNDTWQIDNIQLFPDCEVEVFNRWGEPLFYSKGYNTPWNGTHKGKHVPIGTYYYLIRLHDKEGKFPDHFTGPLTILR